MSNKKGSHVGMVLSFVIFVGFLLFLYTTLYPTVKQAEDKTEQLNNIKEVLLNEIYSNLTSALIKTTQTTICLNITKSELSSYPNFVLKNLANSNLDYFVTSNTMSFKPTEVVTKMYSSPEFLENGTSISNCNTNLVLGSSYTLSAYKTESKIFLNKLNDLLEKIENAAEYKKLKETFSVPVDTEFRLIFEDSAGVIHGTIPENIKKNVIVYDMGIQYINSTADINNGKLKFVVW